MLDNQRKTEALEINFTAIRRVFVPFSGQKVAVNLAQSACAKIDKNRKLFEDIEQQKRESRKESNAKRKIVLKHFQKRSNKEKDCMGWNLLYWCNERAVILEEEHKFHKERNWRFD